MSFFGWSWLGRNFGAGVGWRSLDNFPIALSQLLIYFFPKFLGCFRGAGVVVGFGLCHPANSAPTDSQGGCLVVEFCFPEFKMVVEGIDALKSFEHGLNLWGEKCSALVLSGFRALFSSCF